MTRTNYCAVSVLRKNFEAKKYNVDQPTVYCKRAEVVAAGGKASNFS